MAGAANAGLRGAGSHVFHLLVERERRFPRAWRDRSAHRPANRPLCRGTAGQRPGARVRPGARGCEVAQRLPQRPAGRRRRDASTARAGLFPESCPDHDGPVRVRRLSLCDAREPRLPCRGRDESSAQLRAALARAARPGEWPMDPGARRSQTAAFGHHQPCSATRRRSPLPDPEASAVWSGGRGSGVRPGASGCRALESGGLTGDDVRASCGELARVPCRVRPGRP